MHLKLTALLALATIVMAQVPTPPDPPPEIPSPEEPPMPPPMEPEPEPEPVPEPVPSKPGPDPMPPAPTVTGAPGQGPICECGYTYCAAVLMAMKNPWTKDQLTKAYCSTPNALCGSSGANPATNVTSALFLCRCDTDDAELGTDLDMICGCDTCLNMGPDYRGRCSTPCVSGGCVKNDKGGGGGGGWF